MSSVDDYLSCPVDEYEQLNALSLQQLKARHVRPSYDAVMDAVSVFEDMANHLSIADVDLWKTADDLSTAAHLMRYLYQEVARLNLVVDRLSAVSGGAR